MVLVLIERGVDCAPTQGKKSWGEWPEEVYHTRTGNEKKKRLDRSLLIGTALLFVS